MIDRMRGHVPQIPGLRFRYVYPVFLSFNQVRGPDELC